MSEEQIHEIPDATSLLKVPPHSIEAEQSVIGGLLLDNERWDSISSLVTAEDFYRNDHRIIFRCMNQLIEENRPVDVVTVSEALSLLNELENMGGMSYLADLANNTPTASNIGAYAQIVQERAVVRKLISVAHDISESGFNPQGRNSATLIDEAESKVFQIADGRPNTGGPQSIRPILTKAVERIDELFQTKGAITGLSTGFRDIDNMTSGLQPADLIIIAGRPSMGKTSFAMNIAENAAMNSKCNVVIFSMEMPSDSLIMRMLSSLGRIDQSKIRSGQLGDDDWPRLTSAVTLLTDTPIFVDDTAALTPSEIRARTRRLVREHGDIGLIVIDYLQLMRISGTVENRTGEISEISRSLKSIAKEFHCPVVALSQLNRSLEQRPDKRPVMSDLRESGAIEQDADVIMAIYRDEVYHEEAEKGLSEVIFLKQRNGPIGRKRLQFFGQYTKFEDAALGYEDYM